MPRTGRPKADNPRTHKLTVRLSDEEFDLLSRFAKQEDLDLAKVIRRGVLELLANITK